MEGGLNHPFHNNSITWLELSLERIGSRHVCGRCQAVLGPHGYRHPVLHVVVEIWTTYFRRTPSLSSPYIYLSFIQFAPVMTGVDVSRGNERAMISQQDKLDSDFVGFPGVAGPDGLPRSSNSWSFVNVTRQDGQSRIWTTERYEPHEGPGISDNVLAGLNW